MSRIGAEEFALLLFKTDANGGFTLTEKIRKQVENITIECEGQDIDITTSVGIAQNRESDQTFAETFLRSDKALYSAKDQGRNPSCLLN